jgi:hypothetical protein
MSSARRGTQTVVLPPELHDGTCVLLNGTPCQSSTADAWEYDVGHFAAK